MTKPAPSTPSNADSNAIQVNDRRDQRACPGAGSRKGHADKQRQPPEGVLLHLGTVFLGFAEQPAGKAIEQLHAASRHPAENCPNEQQDKGNRQHISHHADEEGLPPRHPEGGTHRDGAAQLDDGDHGAEKHAPALADRFQEKGLDPAGKAGALVGRFRFRGCIRAGSGFRFSFRSVGRIRRGGFRGGADSCCEQSAQQRQAQKQQQALVCGFIGHHYYLHPGGIAAPFCFSWNPDPTPCRLSRGAGGIYAYTEQR